MASRSRLFWLALPALLAFATRANAEPTAQQKELARDLMQRGYAARNAHDPKTALESFRSADEIMHVPTTTFELARSQADVGMLVEAHETLLSLLRVPARPGEPQAFRDARGYAQVLDTEIVPRIASLRLSVSGTTTAPSRVVVDGASLPDGALLVPYKVDPGHHVVVARWQDGEGHVEVDVREGETKGVTIPWAASAPAHVETAAAPPAPVAPSPPGRHVPGPLVWAGLGIAVAGVGLGTVTGVLTLHDKSTIAAQCNGTRCPPSTYGALSSANTLATVSTISFVVAALGAAGGVTAWFLRPAPETSPEHFGAAALRITPYLFPGAVGATGTF